MKWSVDFSPLIPAPLFWAAAVVAVLLVTLLFIRRSRGADLRAAALLALLAALANPTLREEERESLANIVVVIVDESTSQTLAKRPVQLAAIRSDLESKLGKIPNLEIRWVTAAKPGESSGQGTQLF